MRGSHLTLNLLQSPKTEKLQIKFLKLPFKHIYIFLVIPPDENSAFHMYTHLTHYAAKMGGTDVFHSHISDIFKMKTESFTGEQKHLFLLRN